jgi:capsular polysaccharide biosynthesis protein
LNNEIQPPYEDEIDLHELVLSFWRRRWVILIVTLVVPLIVLALSLGTPSQYQALAYVSLRAPILRPVGDTNLQLNSPLPDINTVMNLAMTTGTLESVLADPAVAAVTGDKAISATDLENMTSINTVGKDQLSLQVTDTDPQRAAILANAWARQVVTIINKNYGMGGLANSLSDQTSQIQQKFEKAQTALQDELSKSHLDTLNAQLQGKQDSLDCLIGKIRQTSDIMDDLLVLKQRLEALPPNSSLTLDDSLSLTTVQQRALSGRVCSIDVQALRFQINYNFLSNPTQVYALASINQIQNDLQRWQSNAAAQQTQFEQGIPQLQQSIETAKSQIRQLTDMRDQYSSLYQSLKLQQNLISASQIDGNLVATQSIQAVPSDVQVSSGRLRNTALAGLAGLTIALIWVFLQDWWQKYNAKKLKSNQVPPRE